MVRGVGLSWSNPFIVCLLLKNDHNLVYNFYSCLIYLYIQYNPKTSQMIQSALRKEFSSLTETDFYIDISFDGQLETEMEKIVIASEKIDKMYTQEEIKYKINKNKEKEKEKQMKIVPKEKRQLRIGFQSNQLKLRFQSVVNQVPGRSAEAWRIFDFVAMSENGTTTPLCLHGNTGCGKTSLITKAMNFFKSNSRTVSVAYFNCMSMWSPTQVYTGILSQLYGVKQKNPSQAIHDRLKAGIGNHQFTKIIILDEIDQFTNDQRFLYNMLEWLWVGAKLILVLISNVIDLAVKLDAKLQSRLKFETIIFAPYGPAQVEQIIYRKYVQIGRILKKEVVTFAAKKIANTTSDIRVLEKIFAKVERQFNQKGGKEKLNIHVVNNIINEEVSLPKLPAELMPYVTILKILHKSEKKQQISQEVMHRLFLQSSKKPQSRDVLMILCDIQDCGLITLTTKKSCDVMYYDYGIKIHQSLHMLLRDDEVK